MLEVNIVVEGVILMADAYNIAVIPGDLNGITVTDAALQLSDAVSSKLTKPISHKQFLYGVGYFLDRDITELGRSELEELAKHDQIFLGAVGDPHKISPGVLEVGILLRIRQAFDQYVNLRPVVLPEGVDSVLVGKGPEDINFEILRENSEGLYADIGWVEKQGTEEEAAYQVMKCTYAGVKRLAEYAEERAIARRKDDKPTLHFVFKTNVLTYAASPWNRVFEEYNDREDIDVKYMHIDNFLMQMLVNPRQFDVVITENMFGDIATDAGAIIQGGIGTAVSGNINPTGEFPSMFEPVHGTAPDKWYGKDGMVDLSLRQLIRPEAAFLSYAMMLEHMGETEASEAMKAAALANIRDPDYNKKGLDELVRQAIEFVERAA